MIQSRAKNRYWQAGRRWRPTYFKDMRFENLDFENYDFILGDKIYTEPGDEARAAFETVKMWYELQS